MALGEALLFVVRINSARMLAFVLHSILIIGELFRHTNERRLLRCIFRYFHFVVGRVDLDANDPRSHNLHLLTITCILSFLHEFQPPLFRQLPQINPLPFFIRHPRLLPVHHPIACSIAPWSLSQFETFQLRTICHFTLVPERRLRQIRTSFLGDACPTLQQ